jgi:hypothetical protein
MDTNSNAAATFRVEVSRLNGSLCLPVKLQGATAHKLSSEDTLLWQIQILQRFFRI